MIGAEKMRVIARPIKKALNDEYCFALLVFEKNKPGMGNYLSDGPRANMIKAMKETVRRLERNQDVGTPEEN